MFLNDIGRSGYLLKKTKMDVFASPCQKKLNGWKIEIFKATELAGQSMSKYTETKEGYCNQKKKKNHKQNV